MSTARVPYAALVGVPIGAFVLACGLVLVHDVAGVGPVGASDASMAFVYAVLGVLALGTLVELVAVPWAIVRLVRHPQLRGWRAAAAIVFGALYAATFVGVIGVTAMYAAGA